MNINAEVKKAIVKRNYSEAKKILVKYSDSISLSTYNKYIKIINSNKLHNDNHYNELSKQWNRIKVFDMLIQLALCIIVIVIALMQIDFLLIIMMPIILIVDIISIYNIIKYNKTDLQYLVSKRYDDSRKGHIEINVKYEINNTLKQLIISMIPLIIILLYFIIK